MKPKACMTKKDQITHWQQLHLQAKADGNTKMAKIYEALLLKLGSKPLKI